MADVGEAGQAATAMFPLNTTLLPGAAIPLHVFEDRYRALARHCVGQDEPLGVVMIERGSEVGGGDQRSTVGCLARVAQHMEMPDGRWMMVVEGTERIQVQQWLDDDPYPRAIVNPWPDAHEIVSAEQRANVVARVRRLRALAVELGMLSASAEIDAELEEMVRDEPDDSSTASSAAPGAAHEGGFGTAGSNGLPAAWTFRLCGLVPAGPYDRQQLLGAHGPASRLVLLATMLDDLETLLEARLSGDL